jgi:Tfp pilus assembly protein PilN
MSTQTLQTAGGSAPRVNLMPPELAEAAQLRQIQAVMGAVVLLAIVIVGALWYHERSAVSSAKNGLASAQAAQAGLNSKLASLQSVKDTEADLAAKQALLTQAMGNEVRWSYLLNDMSFRLPSGVYLTSMNVTETSTTSGQIGTVSFADVGATYNDVAATLEALAKERGFTSPVFGSSSESVIGTHKVVNFSTTVGLTSDALSGRYTAPAAATATPGVGAP